MEYYYALFSNFENQKDIRHFVCRFENKKDFINYHWRVADSDHKFGLSVPCAKWISELDGGDWISTADLVRDEKLKYDVRELYAPPKDAT